MSSDSLNYDEPPFSEEDRPPQSAKRECSNPTDSSVPRQEDPGPQGEFRPSGVLLSQARKTARSGVERRFFGRPLDPKRIRSVICVHESRNLEDAPPYLDRQSVSRQTRELMVERHPRLAEHDGHRSFACYILGSTFRSDYNGRVIIDADTVAKCYGLHDEYYQGRIRTGDLLLLFKQAVAPQFMWMDKTGEGKAREVMCTGLDADVIQAVEADYAKSFEALRDPVHFFHGHKINPTWMTRQRKQKREEIEQSPTQAPCGVAKDWREYLHDVPASAFEDVKCRLGEARNVVAGFEESKRREVRRQFRAVEARTKPLYRFSNRSVRLKSDGQTLQTIDGDVRAVLLQDYEKLDLSSAQLAVMAAEWGCEKLHTFLSEGRDVWAYLCREVGVPYTKANKAVLKTGVYSTGYGALKGSTVGNMALEADSYRKRGHDIDVDSDVASRFLEVDLIEEVFEARDRELDRIEEEGGAEDCFGRWMSLRVRAQDPECDNPAPSILAAKNQAVEMWLLEPALRLAEEELEKARPNFRIVLNLHDGFAVKHYRCEDYNRKRLIEAVNERAEDAGVPTRLEVEE